MRPATLAGIIGVWAMTAIASDRGKNAYLDLLGDPDGRLAKTPGSDLNIVTPDIRDEVILYLRRYASGADAFSGNNTGLSHNPSGRKGSLLETRSFSSGIATVLHLIKTLSQILFTATESEFQEATPFFPFLLTILSIPAGPPRSTEDPVR